MCLVLHVEAVRWIKLIAAVESQQSICDGNEFGPLCLEHPTSEAGAGAVSVQFLCTLQIAQRPSELHDC